MQVMRRSRPILVIAPVARLRRHLKATSSTSRSERSWPRSSRSKSKAYGFDPALAELCQDRLGRLGGELHTKLRQLGRTTDEGVETAPGKTGIDLDRVGKRLDPEHVGRRARRRIDPRQGKACHLRAEAGSH